MGRFQPCCCSTEMLFISQTPPWKCPNWRQLLTSGAASISLLGCLSHITMKSLQVVLWHNPTLSCILINTGATPAGLGEALGSAAGGPWVPRCSKSAAAALIIQSEFEGAWEPWQALEAERVSDDRQPHPHRSDFLQDIWPWSSWAENSGKVCVWSTCDTSSCGSTSVTGR